jgi:hypothetical protein
MNKWQIICPVAVIILAVMFLLMRHHQPEQPTDVLAQTQMIGQDLASTTNSSRLSRITPILRQRLSDLLSSPSSVAEAVLGDEPAPVGDGNACSHLVLSNAAGARIGIRLAPEPGSDKFYVLGFRTIADGSGVHH